MGAAKKVTVAADSKEGLKEGLDKAKEILGHGATDELEPMDNSSEDEEETEPIDNPEEESQELVDQVESPEEADALIKKLQAKKAELLLKK
jgi:hypothetical protein